jgi:hypothetical protein
MFTQLGRRYENGETRNMADFYFYPFQISIYEYLGFCHWFQEQQTEASSCVIFIEKILNP